MIRLLLNDIRFAVRMMRRSPGFTVTVVLTIAVAIAANATIFTVVNAVMIKPLPFPHADRIVQVAEKNDKLNLPRFGSSVLNFVAWREQAHSFQDLAGVGFANFTLTGSGEPEQFPGDLISPSFIRVLGVAPLAGRAFTADEELPGAPRVAMVSEGFWRRRFGADPSLVGRSITLNGESTLVVGIAPATMNLIYQPEVYTPLRIDPGKEVRLNHVIVTFGRLKPGVTVSQAQAEMNAISLRVDQQYPEIRDWGVSVVTLLDTFLSPELKTGLLMLLIAVGLVLLVACANIANLLLSRAAAREKEMAVRTAIGASRFELLRQVLVESTALSITGGAAGLIGALFAVRLFARVLPPGLLPSHHLAIDSNVLWFAFGLTIATGLVFGMIPAIRNASIDPEKVLRQSGRSSTSRLSGRFRDGIVAGELALATVLLIGAGLLVESLARLQTAALGFDSNGIITFQLALPPARYPVGGKATVFYRSLIEALQSIPGARGAAASSGLPFGNGNYTTHPVFTTDGSTLPPDTKVPIDWRIVTPGYFKMMHIPLLAGRDFTGADGPDGPKVLIVSKATAKKFWGSDNPLGKTLRRSADPHTPFTVIGLVDDVHDSDLGMESPSLYYSAGSRVAPLMDVAVRSAGRPEELAPAIRQKVHELDADLALAHMLTLDEWVSTNVAQPKFNALLLAGFAVVALLLAAIGIYGVLSYSVNQRTREIGVRMALGAERSDVLRLIVREGMKVALIGVAIGLVAALALGRFLSSLVFGVTVRDPATFAVVAVVLSAVAFAACVIPARRAARVDPIVALRDE
jgi:putative ABC transport system permease protein